MAGAAPLAQIVVMGVSGAGKSTTGRALAAKLGREFIEGDAFHPLANIRKMAAGVPLTDPDRAPWLAARRGHFFAPELLDSQLATLEMPGPGEGCVFVDLALPVESQVEQAVRGLCPP
ncbi:gluconokinase [Paracoccus jeotgali]|uniref:gluconokinase n=1 Tax=Paracoccus jeotgali TaxID=2065379 RepID=UPI0028AC0403|nr:shikimate kinase [Paracoccus jeotgali]